MPRPARRAGAPSVPKRGCPESVPESRAHFGAWPGPSRLSASATGPRPPPAPRALSTHSGREAYSPTPQRRQQAPGRPPRPQSRRHSPWPRAARRTACPPPTGPATRLRSTPSCCPGRPAQPGSAAQAQALPGSGRPPGA